MAKAFKLLLEIKKEVFFPMVEKNGHVRSMSNGDLRRLLNDKAIQVNNSRPSADTEIDYPIDQLIFFPKSRKRVTYEDYYFTDPEWENSPNKKG